MAMEYYDSTNNTEHYLYYLKKNKKLLTNEEVLKCLDNLHINEDLKDVLFLDKNKFEVNENHNNYDSNYIEYIDNNFHKENEPKLKKLENSKIKQQAEDIVKNCISVFEEKIKLMCLNLESQITEQNSIFVLRSSVKFPSSKRKSTVTNFANKPKRSSILDLTVINNSIVF